MALPPDLTAFLITLFRGAQLAAQALFIGGVVFLLAVARPFAATLGKVGLQLNAASCLWTRRAAILLSSVAAAAASLNVLDLRANLGLTISQSLGADFVRWSTVMVVAATAGALASRRRAHLVPQTIAALVVLCASAMSSHAAAQVHDRMIFLAAELLHQGGAGAWIGGIPFLLLALGLVTDRDGRFMVGMRCSQVFMVAVSCLAVGALILGVGYTGSVAAFIGTAYGAMMAAKAVLLASLLLLGFMNMRSIRRLAMGGTPHLFRLRRFAEAEIGIGLAVMFVAASLASQPPAADQALDPNSVATVQDIAARLTPLWPRLDSPPHSDISIPSDIASSSVGNAADRAWSEFNHHWSGLFVLAMGLLALAERTRRADWARHWPLLFLGLAALLFIRSDPESWPLGPLGFFETLADPEVLQHRLLTLLIVAFGLFEWAVRTNRLTANWARLAFPLLCALGGALLMTHSHSLSDIKQRYLIELSHIPMGMVGMFAGCSRWLELRTNGRVARVAGSLWPICFILIGLLLLDYREG